MTKPSLENPTVSWNKACVPTMSCACPCLICCSARVRALPFCLPESHATWMPNGSNQRLKFKIMLLS